MHLSCHSPDTANHSFPGFRNRSSGYMPRFFIPARTDEEFILGSGITNRNARTSPDLIQDEPLLGPTGESASFLVADVRL